MRPRTRPDQSATTYEFTRNGVHYVCTTVPSLVHEDEKVWCATVEMVPYECFSYTGDEFIKRNDRIAFENGVIDLVLTQTHRLGIPANPELQILRMSEVRPGRQLERRDGQEGRVAEVDVTGRRVLFEVERGNSAPLVWVSIEDVQLSRSNPLFVCPRDFQLLHERTT